MARVSEAHLPGGPWSLYKRSSSARRALSMASLVPRRVTCEKTGRPNRGQKGGASAPKGHLRESRAEGYGLLLACAHLAGLAVDVDVRPALGLQALDGLAPAPDDEPDLVVRHLVLHPDRPHRHPVVPAGGSLLRR
eukprot:7589700-Pyramimonas_sp.AAC.1